MVRWLRWHCPPDTGFEIRALAVWDQARYLSVTEASHNTDFHTWMGKKPFCFFETAETGNRTPNSGVKGSGANHYPRAPAHSKDRKTGKFAKKNIYCHTFKQLYIFFFRRHILLFEAIAIRTTNWRRTRLWFYARFGNLLFDGGAINPHKHKIMTQIWLCVG